MFQLENTSPSTVPAGVQQAIITRMQNATRIFYNRVPKCGSAFVLEVLKTMKNSDKRFQSIHSTEYSLWRLRSETAMRQLMNEFDKYDTGGGPWVFDRHLFFVDFTQYNRTNPLYINFVRKPIDGFFSQYHYIRELHPPPEMALKRHSMTFEECVYSNHSECSMKTAFRIVPFFCGHSEICVQPSRKALQLAMHNVNKFYGVVALNEDMLNGLALLEQTTPKLFKGLTTVAASMINRRINKRKKKVKRPTKALAIMEDRLHYDNELYAFLKQRYMLFKRYFQTESFVKQTLGSINQTVPGHS